MAEATRVLIAASSAPLRRLLAQRLEREGMRAVEAVDVTSAMAALERENVDSMIVTGDMGAGDSGVRFVSNVHGLANARDVTVVLLLEQPDLVQDLDDGAAEDVSMLSMHRFRSINVLARTITNLNRRAMTEGPIVRGVRKPGDPEPEPAMTEQMRKDYESRIAAVDATTKVFRSVVRRVRDNRLPGPMMPDLLAKVQKTLADPNVTLVRVSAVVEKHQVLSSKILSLANSAFFARGAKVTVIANAVQRLGLDETGAMMQAVAVLSFVVGKHRGLKNMLIKNLRTAYFVALVARALAGVMRHARPPAVYTIGLFHNIGATFFLYTLALLHERGELEEVDERAIATVMHTRADNLNNIMVQYLELPSELQDIYGFDEQDAVNPTVRCVHRAMWIANRVLEHGETRVVLNAEAELLGLNDIGVRAINEQLDDLLILLGDYVSGY